MAQRRSAFREKEIAALRESLGGIGADRIGRDPTPGTVTERQYLRAKARKEAPWELIDRTLVAKIGSWAWAFTACEFLFPIHDRAEARQRGRGGMSCPFRLAPGVIRAPTCSFISRRQIESMGEPMPDVVPFAPEWALDARHEGNTPGELERKRREYFGSGTLLLWEVDPVAEIVDAFTSPIEFRRFTVEDTLDGSSLFPEVRLRLGDAFRRHERRGTATAPLNG